MNQILPIQTEPPKRTDPRLREKALKVLDILEKAYPEAQCALNFANPFQLLVATILSAQCTDQQVNRVTLGLFQNFPDAETLAEADPSELENLIRPTGFFRNKARNLTACARALVERHGGRVPETLEELVLLPGVGRKTANVVLGNVFKVPGMVVDTHVKRVAFRLGWTGKSDPGKIERELCGLLPVEKWIQAGHILIFHGRRICKAPTPLCSRCPVQDFCPRAGVKKSR